MRVKHCGPDLKEFRNHIGRRRLTGQLPGHVRRLGGEGQPCAGDPQRKRRRCVCEKCPRDNAVGQYISFVDSDDWIDSTMIAELVSCAAEYHTDVTGMLYRVVYSNGWKTDMRIADDVPDIIYSKTAWNHFMDATKNYVKENKKALTGITLDGQEKYLWLFYFRFPHLYCKLLHFYHFLRKIYIKD